MKLGISNLFEKKVSKDNYEFLIKDLHCIDWAPTVSFGNWEKIFVNKPSDSTNLKYDLSALQSIFFGVNRASLLSNDDDFYILLEHFKNLIDLCEYYKVKYILWGAPGTRIYKIADLSNAIIYERIEQILSLFDNTSVILLLEAVSPKYNCQFINSTLDLLQFYDKNRHRNIALHLDIGQMLDEGLNVLDILQTYKEEVVHLHLSNPDYTYTKELFSLFLGVIDIFDYENNVDIVYEIQNLDQFDVQSLKHDLNKLLEKVNDKKRQ